MPARGLLLALLFLTVSPQVQTRFPVHVESPIYPPLAVAARIVGDVLLAARIDSDGGVTLSYVVSGHPLLVQAALDNLKKWKFQPGESQEMEITYHFKVNGTPGNYPQSECTFDLPNSVTISSRPFPIDNQNATSGKSTSK
jgi:TonB family protein